MFQGECRRFRASTGVSDSHVGRAYENERVLIIPRQPIFYVCQMARLVRNEPYHETWISIWIWILQVILSYDHKPSIDACVLGQVEYFKKIVFTSHPPIHSGIGTGCNIRCRAWMPINHESTPYDQSRLWMMDLCPDLAPFEITSHLSSISYMIWKHHNYIPPSQHGGPRSGNRRDATSAAAEKPLFFSSQRHLKFDPAIKEIPLMANVHHSLPALQIRPPPGLSNDLP